VLRVVRVASRVFCLFACDYTYASKCCHLCDVKVCVLCVNFVVCVVSVP